MNRIKWIVVFVFPMILFPACQSAKSVQRQMQNIQSELFYELTTPVYSENIDNTIYLNPVSDSVTISYTTVNKKGGKVIPLLFYNLVQNKYEVELGNYSLIQPYNEFLTDALMAQCNRSSCFNLKVNDNFVIPDSALILEIEVNKNATTAKMVNKDVLFFIPISWDFTFGSSSWEVGEPVSWLEISARLMQKEKCLWEKTYSVTKDLPYKRKGIEDPFYAYETCIENMTECLSYTTKDVVENISQNLHIIMLAK